MKTLADRSLSVSKVFRTFAVALVVLSLLPFDADALPQKKRVTSHRRPASVATAPVRKPASNTVKSPTIVHAKHDHSGPHIHPPMQSLDFGGRTFQYIEKTNERGAVTQQYLLGKDRIEMINDRDGDGQIDTWDIYTSSGKMTLSNPYKGQLTSLDIEVTTRQGIMRYSYYWAPGMQTYVLLSQRGRPYKRFSKSAYEFIVGCTGSAEDLKLGDLANKLDEALDNGSLESELRSNLLNSAVDGSCKQGSYAAQTENIVSGLMKIAKSDNKKGSGAGQYLQCMRHYKLDLHANRIAASGFAQYTSIVPDGKYDWKITCEPPNDVQWGEYKEGAGPSEPPQISLFLDGAGMSEFTEKAKPSKADMEQAYARLVFHEMLHFSGMDEEHADAVEDCCAPDGNNTGSSSCDYLAALTNDQSMKQVFQNVIIERLGGAKGEGGKNFASLLDVVRRSTRNSEEAETKFNSTLMNLAMEYNSRIQQPGCKGPGGELVPACKKEFVDYVSTQINEMYDPSDGSDCRRAADAKLGVEEGRQTCTLLKEILTAVVNEGTKSDALKKICPVKVESSGDKVANYDSTSPFFALLSLGSLGLRQQALALDKTGGVAGSSMKPTMCNIADDLQTGPISPTSTPSDYVSDWLPKVPQSNAGSGATPESNNQAITQNPSRGKTTIDYKGPSRPLFTNDSPQRTNAIVNHIQNTDNAISNFQSIAEKSFNVLVPQAQASSEAWQQNKIKTDTSYKKSDFRDGYALQPDGPKTINNPLSNFGKDGAGGAPIPSSRMPASVAPVGAARESGVKAAGANAVANGVAGTAGAAGASAGGKANAKVESEPGSDRPVRKLSPSEERALDALKTFLQRDDFAKVKKELDRPSVEASLLDHGVQVVDDTGRTYGSGFPDYRFVYDPKTSKLVPDRLPARSPAKRGR